MAEPLGQTGLQRVVIRIESRFTNVRAACHPLIWNSLGYVFVRSRRLTVYGVFGSGDQGLIELDATRKVCGF